MDIEPDVLAKLAANQFCAACYALCDDFPARLDLPKSALNAREILAAAHGHLEIEKLKGPGQVYRLLSAPDGIGLNLIIKSHGHVETDLTLHLVGARTTCAILCHALHTLSTGGPPQPPYPRPRCVSAEEFIAVAGRFLGLASMLKTALSTP